MTDHPRPRHERARRKPARAATIVSTAIITAILTSALWIFAYNIVVAPRQEPLSPAGNAVTVDPRGTAPVEIAEGLVVGPAGLAIPVAGVDQDDLLDTFTQSRAGGRAHDAIDIMAPHGTPVIAAAPGTVEKIFFSDGGGGNTVYIRSDDGRWTYYYAHLQGYAPGLAEEQRIRRGQIIGRVGSSGNASPEGPHLHFAIHRMQPSEKWYEGDAINPYPLLAGKQVSG